MLYRATIHRTVKHSVMSSLQVIRGSSQQWKQEYNSLRVLVDSLLAHQGRKQKEVAQIVSESWEQNMKLVKKILQREDELKRQLETVKQKAASESEQLIKELQGNTA